ncbi:AP-3 complex subunit beta-2 [Smittium culicis]|uniref:AP-3 complex subunit beta-2 n=1 Tax=Smittium culicis TaxID=133412 RepID=A0A1R1XUQ8_9FUNG|nr:AP-3 complex subunit beta-2 [Smittium culicis]
MSQYFSKAISIASNAAKISLKASEGLVENARELKKEIDGEIYDNAEAKIGNISKELSSNLEKEILVGLKRIIILMGRGFDLSMHFPLVVKNVESKSIEIRKLVYIFLTKYAEKDPDLALLSINTFQKDLSDRNHSIRAMALKVLSGIKIRQISPLIVMSIKKCSSDPSPHVRKAAAMATIKVFRNDPTMSDQLIEIVKDMMIEQSPLAIGAIVTAFETICGNDVNAIHQNFRRCCEMLVDVDEWGQIAVIQMLVRSANLVSSSEFLQSSENKNIPLDQDFELLLAALNKLLHSRNNAVVMVVVSAIFELAPISRIETLWKPLLRLLKSSPEIEALVVVNLYKIASKYPNQFLGHSPSFFIKASDSDRSESTKIEILSLCASLLYSEVYNSRLENKNAKDPISEIQSSLNVNSLSLLLGYELNGYQNLPSWPETQPNHLLRGPQITSIKLNERLAACNGSYLPGISPISNPQDIKNKKTNLRKNLKNMKEHISSNIDNHSLTTKNSNYTHKNVSSSPNSNHPNSSDDSDSELEKFLDSYDEEQGSDNIASKTSIYQNGNRSHKKNKIKSTISYISSSSSEGEYSETGRILKANNIVESNDSSSGSESDISDINKKNTFINHLNGFKYSKDYEKDKLESHYKESSYQNQANNQGLISSNNPWDNSNYINNIDHISSRSELPDELEASFLSQSNINSSSKVSEIEEAISKNSFVVETEMFSSSSSSSDLDTNYNFTKTTQQKESINNESLPPISALSLAKNSSPTTSLNKLTLSALNFKSKSENSSFSINSEHKNFKKGESANHKNHRDSKSYKSTQLTSDDTFTGPDLKNSTSMPTTKLNFDQVHVELDSSIDLSKKDKPKNKTYFDIEIEDESNHWK